MTPKTDMPPFKQRYEKAHRKLITDPLIHPANRDLFRGFFEFESYKLKRLNGLQELDDAAYKTLYAYIVRFRNVNRWFENKPLTELTKDDIQRIYDGLEDGKIVNHKGLPYASRTDYYSKIFKSKLFRLAGKDELARSVIEFARPNRNEVRFITESDFRRLVRRVRTPRNQLLLWLAWDYGENIGALIRLIPEDFHRQIDHDTGEPEYRLNFRPEILKRSRRSRSELTNYPETVDLLDEVLPTVLPGESIFTFGYRYAKEIMDRTVKRAKITCQPNGERLTWKVLRSSMACDLLSKGWTRDEVNARLGHTPSSDEIDKYINFLALDRRRPKQKVADYQARRLGQGRQLDRTRSRPDTTTQMSLADQMAAMKQALMAEIRAEIEAAQSNHAA